VGGSIYITHSLEPFKELVLIFKELTNLPPSSMCNLSNRLLSLSTPDMPFPVPLPTLGAVSGQACNPPHPLSSFPFCGQYSVPKGRLLLIQCGEWFLLPFFIFSLTVIYDSLPYGWYAITYRGYFDPSQCVVSTYIN
jgi:hypothetical protein